MRAQDIGLGLELGERYGVPMPLNTLLADKYGEAMDKYGPDSGSSIPCRFGSSYLICAVFMDS